jgi:hypothetical protein
MTNEAPMKILPPIQNKYRKLDKLHDEAVQFAAHLLSRTLREALESPDLQRLKRIANKASDRAERRYQASLTAYRESRKNEL